MNKRLSIVSLNSRGVRPTSKLVDKPQHIKTLLERASISLLQETHIFFLILSQDLHQYPLDEGYQPSSNGSWGWFKILFLILHEIVVLKTERVNCFK
jgi:hypothetical protein